MYVHPYSLSVMQPYLLGQLIISSTSLLTMLIEFELALILTSLYFKLISFFKALFEQVLLLTSHYHT
jgi:hypothetical protein